MSISLTTALPKSRQVTGRAGQTVLCVHLQAEMEDIASAFTNMVGIFYHSPASNVRQVLQDFHEGRMRCYMM